MIVGSSGHSTHVRATQSLGTSTVQGAQGDWSASIQRVKGGAIYSASSHCTEPVWRLEFEARGSSK